MESMDWIMMQISLFISSFRRSPADGGIVVKEMRNRIIAGVLFIVLTAGILYGVNWIFQLKTEDGCYPMQMFYKQERNSVDVLCLGSSHTYTNINPAVLWDEYGMASYDLASSNQPLWNSYYYFKEALKYQTPELVVLDVYRAIESNDYVDEIRTAMNLLGMRYSKDWVECLRVSLKDEKEFLDYFLRYPIYHAKYQELNPEDFMAYNSDANGANYKGFNLKSKNITVFEKLPDISGVTEVGAMTDKAYEYLEKIILLAKEKNVTLFLVNAPYMDVSAEHKMIFNQVAQLAEAYEIEFVDFNEYFVEIGLNPATDFAEGSHLNYSGNVKYSKYLADYIHENYEVSDRRDDVRYASWEKNSDFYWKHAQNEEIRKITDMQSLFENVFAAEERYTICVTLDGEYESAACDMHAFLAKYGMDTQEAGTWVFKNGQLVYSLSKVIADDSFYYEDLGEKSLTVLTEMQYNAELEEYYPYKRICMEGIGVDAAANGINIFVYDNELQQIVVLAGLDAANGYQMVRY